MLIFSIDDQTHWEKLKSTSPVNSKSFIPPFTETLAINVEMTAYALLTYVVQNDMENCLPIAKWLLAQRNPTGGFVSTQVSHINFSSHFFVSCMSYFTAYNFVQPTDTNCPLQLF